MAMTNLKILQMHLTLFLLCSCFYFINSLPITSKPLDNSPDHLTWETWLSGDVKQTSSENGGKRKITKSIFITPNLNNITAPSCPPGYKIDNGKCIQIVNINQVDILVTRLQSLLSSSNHNNHGIGNGEDEVIDEGEFYDYSSEAEESDGPLQINLPLSISIPDDPPPVIPLALQDDRHHYYDTTDHHHHYQQTQSQRPDAPNVQTQDESKTELTFLSIDDVNKNNNSKLFLASTANDATTKTPITSTTESIPISFTDVSTNIFLTTTDNAKDYSQFLEEFSSSTSMTTIAANKLKPIITTPTTEVANNREINLDEDTDVDGELITTTMITTTTSMTKNDTNTDDDDDDDDLNDDNLPFHIQLEEEAFMLDSSTANITTQEIPTETSNSVSTIVPINDDDDVDQTVRDYLNTVKFSPTFVKTTTLTPTTTTTTSPKPIQIITPVKATSHASTSPAQIITSQKFEEFTTTQQQPPSTYDERPLNIPSQPNPSYDSIMKLEQKDLIRENIDTNNRFVYHHLPVVQHTTSTSTSPMPITTTVSPNIEHQLKMINDIIAENRKTYGNNNQNNNGARVRFPTTKDDETTNSVVKFPGTVTNRVPNPSNNRFIPDIFPKKHHQQQQFTTDTSTQKPPFWWLPTGWEVDQSGQKPLLLRFWSRMPLVRDPSLTNTNTNTKWRTHQQPTTDSHSPSPRENSKSPSENFYKEIGSQDVYKVLNTRNWRNNR
uniref:Putative secreted mucin n=1 Tax=Corethrella appendiculata TaxID=1370023 RepID=U5EXA8_9DIPT